MQTKTDDVSSLFLDGLFTIPDYQRGYSWEEPQLEDLLDDLLYLPDGKDHFFGNVILEKHSEQYQTDKGRRFDVFDVVDGQQRLTTTMLFLYAAAQTNGIVSETLSEDSLLFPVDERPRLLPQDQDREFFRDCLFGDSVLDPETPSQERLVNAFEFYKQTLNELDSSGTVQKLSERLRYDCILNIAELDDNSEAASIFESLNDRGRDLSSLDKTKSFLMYMDDRSSNYGALKNQINDRFGSIYRELFVLSNGHSRVNDFDEDAFQRFHWGLYDGYTSDEYYNSLDTLRDRLRESFRNGDYGSVQTEIDTYTKGLREAASAFSALFNPSKRPPNVKESLIRLLELGRIANVLPVLIAAQLRYGDDEPEEMDKIVNSCETLVFRVYAIDRRRADTGRSKLVSLAHNIQTDKFTSVEDIISRLESITRRYADNDRFRRNLRDPEFYDSITSRDIRYLLHCYGQNLESIVGEDVQNDLAQILSKSFEVEHILAKRLDKANIPDNLIIEFDEYVDRLGNLTIANEYWNKRYSNLPFEKKQQAESQREVAYETSTLRVQRVLADLDGFGKSEIEQRENEIIDFALERWGFTTPEVDESTEQRT